ncbi:Cleavage Stimulation Factor Subunit 3 [Manis pentadactyla]|nr:Cleavage Stimulation Factor Subunit 3 [Manis pentadactyla]
MCSVSARSYSRSKANGDQGHRWCLLIINRHELWYQNAKYSETAAERNTVLTCQTLESDRSDFRLWMEAALTYSVNSLVRFSPSSYKSHRKTP